MKTLITGGAGFIGSQLTDYLLSKGHEVTVIDNLSWGKKEFLSDNFKNTKFKFIKLDLLDKDNLTSAIRKDIDTVFHLAANSDIMRSTIDPEIDLKNTTIATFNLLDAMRIKRVKRIFFTSGSGIYGDVGDKYTDEAFGPLLPISMYGASKLSAEGMISSFVNLFDMQAWMLRPANIIGPRATHGVIFDFINQLKENPKKLKVLGDGTQSKSYLYVSDVINAVDLVWKKAKKSINIFNLASTSFITVSEIADIVIKEMDLKNVKMEFTGGNRGWKGDVPIVRLTNRRIEKLGWKSNYTSKEAVKKTVRVLLGKTK
jgi:UDP-glucose 4-epimerase